MQQFCTYGSVRGASGQPTSLPRQNRVGRANLFFGICFLGVQGAGEIYLVRGGSWFELDRAFKKRYLAAGQYTIADMICYPWATILQGRNIDLNEFPNVKRWLDEIGERPGGKKGDGGGPRVSRRLGDDHTRRTGAALQAACPSAGASGP
jgi:Glutathione S-transferase, C-terminal domain